MDQTVLIVDDEEPVRRTLQLVLGPLCRALMAADGEEALRLIRAEKPTLVLLDVSMPGMGGLRVLREALKASPSLYVIVLSGQQDLRVARRALTEGAKAYFTKPFDARELRAEVKRLLDGASESANSGRPWTVVQ